MTAQVLHYTALPDLDRDQTAAIGTLRDGDQIELRIKRGTGAETTVPLSSDAAKLVESLLGGLARGERVAVLSEQQELSPNDIASILGISRPLVVHRMDVGDLPFRQVGTHRRAALKDVLALKARLDHQRTAMQALAADADELRQLHGV